MFNGSYAFKLLAQPVLQVAEVKLHWHCQKTAAARANQLVPKKADEIWRTQTAAPAGARLLNGRNTTKKSNEARKDDFSCNCRKILQQKKQLSA